MFIIKMIIVYGYAQHVSIKSREVPQRRNNSEFRDLLAVVLATLIH